VIGKMKCISASTTMWAQITLPWLPTQQVVNALQELTNHKMILSAQRPPPPKGTGPAQGLPQPVSERAHPWKQDLDLV
jgi:hypothetical protein